AQESSGLRRVRAQSKGASWGGTSAGVPTASDVPDRNAVRSRRCPTAPTKTWESSSPFWEFYYPARDSRQLDGRRTSLGSMDVARTLLPHVAVDASAHRGDVDVPPRPRLGELSDEARRPPVSGDDGAIAAPPPRPVVAGFRPPLLLGGRASPRAAGH